MSVIKLHIGISVLSWLSVKCMGVLFKEQYTRYKRERNKSWVDRMIVHTCPIFNIIAPIGMLYMAFAPDDFVEEVNRKSE